MSYEMESGRRRTRANSGQSEGGSSASEQLGNRVQAYRAPIVFLSNPWKTWVAWLSSALLCGAMCLFVIVMNAKLWYLSVTLGVFAVALALQAKREKYTFDITSGRCTLKTLSVLGIEVQQYWFHEIKEVRIEESTDTQGGTEVDLYLVLRSGRKIALLAGHLCGLEARVKRQVWSDVSEYLHVSQSQNNLEWNQESQSDPPAQETSNENASELQLLP